MKKEEAIHYIHQMLDQDLERGEIVRSLVEQLHAPQDLIEKFVTKVTADFREMKAQQSENAKPSWLRELQNSANAPPDANALNGTQPELAQKKHSPKPNTTSIKLPPWLQENEPINVVVPQDETNQSSWQQENREFVIHQLEMQRTFDDIADELSSRTGVVPSLSRQFVREVDTVRRAEKLREKSKELGNLSANNTEDEIQLEAANVPSQDEKSNKSYDLSKNPELNEFILHELGQRHKHNDVVLAVCERTDITWEEAERLVAQAGIERHSQQAALRSEIMMFVGVLVTVGGFSLSAIYGLPMLAQIASLSGFSLRLPFNGDFATHQPALAISFLAGGLLLVGVGAVIAYLYYHAAEEHEA